jgi:esterase/lipase superfamily enzyme
MGVAIYGNYGAPILAFPTSCGDEWEQEGQSMIGTLSPYLEQGRIRIFCINSVNSDSFQNKGAHPFHRSWMQAQYDAYVANEVFPFIDSQCQTPGIPIATLGASLGAYHAANTLFKHPDHVKRCYALSGVYDMRDSMDGVYDDNFYFNNPVDYMANQSDPWFLHQYASCDIRLVTGCGPWENSEPTYRMSEILRNRGIAHHLDDWGPEGGHEWPYWHHQMWEYVGAHY